MEALSAFPGFPVMRENNLKNGEKYNTGEKQKRTFSIMYEAKSIDQPKEKAPCGWMA